MHENEISAIILDAAITVHRELGGPGLLESVYKIVLARELCIRGLEVGRQVAVPVAYKGLSFVEAFRADLLVGNKVMVELKCVETISDLYKKQLLTYLRLADKRLGYLLNFNESLMKQGIIRIVNRLPE